MTDETEIRDLLKRAEAQIVQLQHERDDLAAHVDGLMEAQTMEAEQMVRLTEQVWKLEKLLGDVTAERDDIRLLLSSLRDDMEKIRDVAAETLKATKDKRSILDMAVKFYDVKTLADSVKFLKD